MTDREELQLLLELEKRKARHSFSSFVSYTKADYQFNWHHEYMIEKLQDFAKGHIKRLMIFCPPRHGKSELVSRRLPAFLLGANPDNRIIACSYSMDLAASMNRDVQRIIDGPEYRAAFPNTKLNTRNVKASDVFQKTSKRFDIVDHRGYYVAAGVGGGITGLGADFAIIDDPVKNREEALSETIRAKHWEWYTSTLYTRLEKGGSILLTLTRWHEDDLAGRLLEKQKQNKKADQWEVVSFPMLKEDDSDENDPRKIGEPLWIDKFDLTNTEKIKNSISSIDWAALYQQRPAPVEGHLIKGEWFNHYDKVKHTFNDIDFYLDTAYTEKQSNDPTALIAYSRIKNDLYILNCSTVRMEFPELIKYIPKFVGSHGGSTRSRIYVEPKASGLSVVQTLKKETGLNVIADQPPKSDKVSRVHSVAAILEAGRVYLPMSESWTEGFITECKQFPNGKHDDQVDVLVGAIKKGLERKKRGARRMN